MIHPHGYQAQAKAVKTTRLDQQNEETWDRAMERSWLTPRALLPFLFFSTLGGGILSVVIRPWTTALVEAVNASLFSSDHPVYAQLSRASGLSAYILIWLAMLLGLLQSTRLARKWPGGIEAFELHRYVSLLGLSFSLFHVMVLAGDPRVGGQITLLFVPFGMIQVFPWSGWGQFALYGLVLASLSFYMRRFLGKKSWRLVHGLSAAFYVLALVHSVGAGKASSTMLFSSFYWVTGGSIVVFAVYRAGTALLSNRRVGTRGRLAAATAKGSANVMTASGAEHGKAAV